MIPIRPYKALPTYASSFNGPYNPGEAMAFILPRGEVWAIKIPPDSKRFQIYSYEKAFHIWDAAGTKGFGYKYLKSLAPLAARLPQNSVIEVFANREEVIVSDVLYFHDKDLRRQVFQERMAAWWYMPEEYRSMTFFNGVDFSRLYDDLYFQDISKVVFKPNFVSYPRVNGSKVFNWLKMGKPDVVKLAGNVKKPSIRPLGPSYTPRGSQR